MVRILQLSQDDGWENLTVQDDGWENLTTQSDGWENLIPQSDGLEKLRTWGDGREHINNKMMVGNLCLHRVNFRRLCLRGWEIMITKGEGWVMFVHYDNKM